MKKTVIMLLAFAMVFAGVTVVMAKISGSPHDLSTTNAGEICAFCHTPHSASSDAASIAPLWNRVQGSKPYTTYQSATFDMSATVGQPGYGSVGCLVCHNGSSSTLVNYPGPGSTSQSGYDFQMGVTFADATNQANLGTDLSNDHPIGFTYDPALDTGNDNNGFPDSSNGWITGTYAGGKYKLYGSTKDRFECATCHSVHDTATYQKTTWNTGSHTHSALTAGDQVYFLRTSNAGSKLCQDCHQNR